MKRPVVLKLGEREYEFITNEPQSIVDEVFNEIIQEFGILEKEVEKVGLDSVLVAMLVNMTTDFIKAQSELKRLKEKYDAILKDHYKGRGRIAKD
ncbi:MAG: cell division protein ZapA [Thermotogae bacterium]|uniref:Cell division protein ZapA n=1 Tax=Kosmotoga arenicorallina TaxID=688066 RepID=A0A7C5DZK3_9BACT|nr:cell division protein ZapA [Kosmotoga sp.]MBO8166595.1 cell division protein ZapA [Kosmotoga sp.]RKX49246.1 MAG: cell division protein ZapA [Thermotogota bacterium]HHF08523.1 cell division protein ZapA [Kosmotoga arenicorallina]